MSKNVQWLTAWDELAAFLPNLKTRKTGVTVSTARRISLRNGFPARSPNGWRVDEVTSWVRGVIPEFGTPPPPAATGDQPLSDKAALQAEKLRLDVEKQRHQLAVEQERVVPTEEHAEAMVGLARLLVAGLSNLERRLAGHLKNPDDIVTVRTEIDGIRKQLSERVENLGEKMEEDPIS